MVVSNIMFYNEYYTNYKLFFNHVNELMIRFLRQLTLSYALFLCMFCMFVLCVGLYKFSTNHIN